MKVLVACEESQRVCTAFRELGHEAYSCDIQECSGGHPEWHILGNVLPYINGSCEFITMDGTKHTINGKWDLLIAHPPCTYLTAASTRHLSLKCTSAEKSLTECGCLPNRQYSLCSLRLLTANGYVLKILWALCHGFGESLIRSCILIILPKQRKILRTTRKNGRASGLKG